MSLRSGLATPDAKRRYVRRLFATIADRYDLITRVLSFGLDRTWKRRLVELARPVPGAAALDLATGTGDIAFLLHDRAVRTVGLDVTRRMIELARAKCSDSRAPSFVVGDMMSLPFPVASFDVVTTGYGLRNVPDLTTAIDEMYRVLKDGGQALSLDFNRPGPLAVRAAYLAYLNVVGSVLGWILTVIPIPTGTFLRPSAGIPAPLPLQSSWKREDSEWSATTPCLAGSWRFIMR